jgi:hypothetical protein
MVFFTLKATSGDPESPLTMITHFFHDIQLHLHKATLTDDAPLTLRLGDSEDDTEACVVTAQVFMVERDPDGMCRVSYPDGDIYGQGETPLAAVEDLLARKDGL